MKLVKINIWRSSRANKTDRKITPLKINNPSQTPKNENSLDSHKKSPLGQKQCAHTAYQELSDLVGLTGVKNHILEIDAFMEIQKRRGLQKLHNEAQSLHMIFKGNPGTGKTTVARVIGKLFKETGILPKGHLYEIERADIVGEYIGHTAQKTKELIKKSLGGILFIDEAYALARGGEKDFGKEAIDTLVRGMEEHRNNLIIILAGYKREMELFLLTNPGLRSRFPIHIHFPDYSTEELMAIADIMLQKREYYLSTGSRMELTNIIETSRKLHQHHGNARMVRNLIERAMRVQAVRLIQSTQNTNKEQLMTITRSDLLTAKCSIFNQY